MPNDSTPSSHSRKPVPPWEWLTVNERRMLILVTAILLLGMITRYLYLKNQVPEVYNVEVGLEPPTAR